MINLSDIEELAPGFKGWLEEVEVYNSRYERLCYTLPELSQHEWKDVMTWLSAAYAVGYNTATDKH
jgi:hypothetical protein